MTGNIRFICPLIVVSDLPRARHFYESVLGQKVIMDFGENITFEGNFALHLLEHYQGLIDNREVKTGGNDFELYFEFDNMEQLNMQMKESMVSFVHEMREQPWRQRVLRIYDPDKHIIEVGESLEFLSYRLSEEGKNPEEISKITLMPIEFVTDAIKKYSSQIIQ